MPVCRSRESSTTLSVGFWSGRGGSLGAERYVDRNDAEDPRLWDPSERVALERHSRRARTQLLGRTSTSRRVNVRRGGT